MNIRYKDGRISTVLSLQSKNEMKWYNVFSYAEVILAQLKFALFSRIEILRDALSLNVYNCFQFESGVPIPLEQYRTTVVFDESNTKSQAFYEKGNEGILQKYLEILQL